MSDGDYPKVSVAIVTYNQCTFLEECVEAVLAQDYPSLEIVIADDASTDGTRAFLLELKTRHPDRIKLVLAEENGGVTVNQQRALDACTGKYISWMAGDDVMLPGKIRAQVDLMEANPDCAICYHDLDLFDSDSGRTIRRFSAIDTPREGGMAVLVKHGSFNGATSNMVRRSASPDFDTRVMVASDWFYYVGCLADGRTIRYIPKVFGRYRRHAGNVTASTDRSQPHAQFEDHMLSCDLVAERWPTMAGQARARRADLLRMQRWEDGGAKYRDYLRASFALRPTLKVAAALLLDSLFGVKR